jgi:hypothetical protein
MTKPAMVAIAAATALAKPMSAACPTTIIPR